VRTLWRSDGSTVWLGEAIGRGGEGSVHEIAQSPELVAKIYAPAPTADRIAKLRAMVALCTPELTRIAAWPVDTVHDSAGGLVVGFLMPRLTGHRELHKLSHPMDRARTFPDVGYDFLVHVGANIARAFSALHARGLIVGDVNESGIMVHPDGTAMFIDCDSMQFRHESRLYTCDVGKPEFQPPELLRNLSSFRALERKLDYDMFGLGVILFQLLMFGWHPFAVKMLSGDQQPTADNIKEGRFPHALGFRSRDYAPPPHALDTSVFPDFVRDLFERTFVEGRDRPEAGAWVQGLERLAGESRPCQRFGTHTYHHHLLRCPFCDLDARLGFPLLPRITLDAAQLTALWVSIQNAWFELSAPPVVSGDGPLSTAAIPAPATIATHARATVRTRQAQAALAVAAAGLAIVHPVLAVMGLGIAGLELALRKKAPPEWTAAKAARNARHDALRDARAQLEAPLEAAIVQNYEAAHIARERITTFDAYRRGALQRDHDKILDTQLKRWLKAQPLRLGSIKGLPTSTLQALARHGFRTADDTQRLTETTRMSGLSEGQIQQVLKWSHTQLTRFAPDLDDPDYLDIMQKLNDKLDGEYQHLVERMKLAREWLVLRIPEVKARRAKDLADLAEAEADLRIHADEDALLSATWQVPAQRS